MEKTIKQAIQILNQGGIIIFPTDTAFGIGCRVDDEKAIAKLFKLRKRPETKATPVLVSSQEMAQDYTQDNTPKKKPQPKKTHQKNPRKKKEKPQFFKKIYNLHNHTSFRGRRQTQQPSPPASEARQGSASLIKRRGNP